MDLIQAVVLGIVEGLTEFLPVSSTGHLTIAEKLLGLNVADPAVTAYTAVIQIGAILAVLVYFAKDLARIVRGWAAGVVSAEAREAEEYRFGWLIIMGSMPIGVVGLAAKPLIEGPLRSLWFVAGSLVAWSAVMWWAERNPSQKKAEGDLRAADVLVIGLVQCLALVPGVSRSGATISAGLLRGVERVTATKLSFYLGIPALVGAGVLQLPEALGQGIGVMPTVVGTVVSFIVAYASVAWLLRFVSTNRITAFVPYRVVLGLAIMVALGAGWLGAT
ncbi:undecaprenyl-diphosphate phosphatase [Pseudonocardia eucalypti]|uniref:Undecaprenyl-diphosphatase n=1 Tax=Pseudonocardia eucalypti TaxID=648755 RepID=A0ABP9Q6F6_9PSEU|nr:undecaprenyl-diphosphatase [Pseudonocardia eucalypti]